MRKKLSAILVVGIMCFSSALNCMAASKTVTNVRPIENYWGMDMGSITQIMTFSYNTSTKKLTTPKSVSQSYQLPFLNYMKENKAVWESYDTSTKNGEGFAVFTLKAAFGIPTPWGTIGNDYSSIVHGFCSGSGDSSFDEM
jgi:hypothetical protein